MLYVGLATAPFDKLRTSGNEKGSLEGSPLCQGLGECPLGVHFGAGD